MNKRILQITIAALFVHSIAFSISYYWDAEDVANNVNATNPINWKIQGGTNPNDSIPGAADIANQNSLGTSAAGDKNIINLDSTWVIQRYLSGQIQVAGHTAPTLNVNSNGTLKVTDFYVGRSWNSHARDASAIFNINSGGSVTVDQWFTVGLVAGSSQNNTNGATGVININGGSLTVTNKTVKLGSGGTEPAATNATGIINLNSGLLRKIGTGTSMIGDTGAGILNITGGQAIFDAEIKLANLVNSTGAVNVLGGSLSVPNISLGSGDPSLSIGGEGIIVLTNWNIGKLSGFVTNGQLTAISGSPDDSAYSSLYTEGALSFTNTSDIVIKIGAKTNADGGKSSAIWAYQAPTGYFETDLVVYTGYTGLNGKVVPNTSKIEATITIDENGIFSSNNSNLLVSASGDTVPASMLNNSFKIYYQAERNASLVTGRGTSSATTPPIQIYSVSSGTKDSNVSAGMGLHNDPAKNRENIIFGIDATTLPSSVAFELTQVDVRGLGGTGKEHETATLISQIDTSKTFDVNYTNLNSSGSALDASRRAAGGTWGAPDSFGANVTAMEISSSGGTTADLVSIFASTANNPSNATTEATGMTKFNVLGVSMKISPAQFELAPPTISSLTTARSMITPTDRLRVDAQVGALLTTGTVHMAILDSSDNKLEFTAFDNRSASMVNKIFTTKNIPATEITTASNDFTVSGFFSQIINDPISPAITINDSLEVFDMIDLSELSDKSVYVDMTSISGLSGTNTLTVQLIASNDGIENVTNEVNFTVVPDGNLSFTKISSTVTDSVAFEGSQSILIGSDVGTSGNRFTGGADKNRHDFVSPTYIGNRDNASNYSGYGMYFDTTSVGEFTMTDLLIVAHNNSSNEVPSGSGLLKLELWKITTNTTALTLTDRGSTFPDAARELVYVGTDSFNGADILDNDIFKLDFPDIEMEADTRYGWFIELITTEKAAIYLKVDSDSFADGNHLRLRSVGTEDRTTYPFEGSTATWPTSDVEWDILFFINGIGPATYGTWVSENFAGSTHTAEDKSALADPDNDGFNNLLEYALGGNPTVSTDGSILQRHSHALEGGTNYFEYIFNKRSDATDRGLTYTVTTRPNLVFGNWATNTPDQVLTGAHINGFQAVTNRYSLDSHAVQFFELKVTN